MNAIDRTEWYRRPSQDGSTWTEEPRGHRFPLLRGIVGLVVVLVGCTIACLVVFGIPILLVAYFIAGAYR